MWRPISQWWWRSRLFESIWQMFQESGLRSKWKSSPSIKHNSSLFCSSLPLLIIFYSSLAHLIIWEQKDTLFEPLPHRILLLSNIPTVGQSESQLVNLFFWAALQGHKIAWLCNALIFSPALHCQWMTSLSQDLCHYLCVSLHCITFCNYTL